MYSTGHIIFIIISLLMVLSASFILWKKKIKVENIIKVCFVIALALEIIKIFFTIDIVPIVKEVVKDGKIIYEETGKFYPYIKSEHLPFELCSMQIVFLFLARVVKNEKWKRRIYSLIYGSALLGGILAIFLSSIAPDFGSTIEFLTSIRAWEFYIYHAMIIVVAIAIARDEKCYLRFSDAKWTCIILLMLDMITFYSNSIFSIPVYENEKLIGLTHSANYFSSYDSPLGFTIHTKNEYLLYLLTRLLIVGIFIVILYLPFLRRKKCIGD